MIVEVRSAGSAGLGVFAKKLIPRGTRIFSERALLTVHRHDQSSFYPSVQKLSSSDRDVFMDLSASRSKELDVMRWAVVGVHTVRNAFERMFDFRRKGGDGGSQKRNSLSDHVAALSIFRSNSFNIGRSAVSAPGTDVDEGLRSIAHALFPKTARINHSCLPNAQGNYNVETERFNVHATRDIERDEEVHLNYLMEEGAARRSRMERLSEGYGFECTCPACDVGQLRGREGEERRLEMGEKLKGFVMAERGTHLLKETEKEAERELEAIMAFIELFEKEGIAGRELSNMYMKAAELNVDIWKHHEALRLAGQALQVDEDCLGTDHLEYKKRFEIVKALKKGLDENLFQRP